MTGHRIWKPLPKDLPPGHFREMKIHIRGYMLAVEDALKDIDSAYAGAQGGTYHGDFFEALDQLRGTLDGTMAQCQNTLDLVEDMEP